MRDRAGRGGREDYSSRSAPRRLSLGDPAAETPRPRDRVVQFQRWDSRALVPSAVLLRVLAARAAGLAALPQPAPPSPLARFLQ